MEPEKSPGHDGYGSGRPGETIGRRRRGQPESGRRESLGTQADVGKFEALVKRWDSEVGRQVKMVDERVLDQQILGESRRQFESSVASKDAADAAVKTAEAIDVARAADLEKSKVDVEVADARLSVAKADAERVAALYSYTRLIAPYPSIVVLRNANTGDFVLPATGDPSASGRSIDQSADAWPADLRSCADGRSAHLC